MSDSVPSTVPGVVTGPTWGSSARLPGVDPFQLLGSGGEPAEGSPELDVATAVELYQHMALARSLDTEATNLQRQGQLGVYASSRGQEAVQVGVTSALDRARDWLFPAYRELGASVAWGIDVAAILHMWRGTWFSGYGPPEVRAGLQTIPVATQYLHATGFAMGMRLDGHEGAVLSFIGDGATSEGDFHEALNFAGAWQVPCVFVIQNNRYAISVPFEQQTAAERLAYRGIGYGIPSVVVDGNDVLACRQVAGEALERARSGGGPSLIEALTYRMEAHTTSDDPRRYREATEERLWSDRDPLLRLERFLEKYGHWSAELDAELGARVKDACRQLREAIYDAPHGDPLELFEHVFVDSTGFFEEQREQLRSELADGGDN